MAPRIDVHVPTMTHPGLETAHGGKAGIDRDDAAAAFRLAADHPNLDPAGMHLHIGSQITSVEPYRQALDAALDIVGEVEAASGVRLRFLNTGGGFAVTYREAPVACRSSDYFCSVLSPPTTTPTRSAPCSSGASHASVSSLEPGRSIAGTAAVLVTRIENEKTKGERDEAGTRVGDERWLTVDAGFNTLLEHTNYSWYYPAVVVRDPGRTTGDDAVSACRSSLRRRRRVRRRRRLGLPLVPQGTTVGDVVVFIDAGAYSLEMMNPYKRPSSAAAYAVSTPARS